MFRFVLCVTLYLGSQYGAANPVSNTNYVYNRDLDLKLSLHTNPRAFWDAHQHCQQEGGVLVSPTSDELVQAIRTTLSENKLTSSSVFAGVATDAKTDESSNSTRLVLGKALLLKATGEPSSAPGDQCLALSGDGALAEVSCARSHPYLCRKEPLNKCGPKGNGYEYEPRTGSCYKFHRIALGFRPALATCHNEGGLLASIDNDDESNVLREIFHKNPSDVITGTDDPNYALVGFRKYEDGEWGSLFGDTLAQAGFTQWSSGEPNNAGGNEVCGSIYRDGLLNDISCTRPLPYICEIIP